MQTYKLQNGRLYTHFADSVAGGLTEESGWLDRGPAEKIVRDGVRYAKHDSGYYRPVAKRMDGGVDAERVAFSDADFEAYLSEVIL